MLTRDASPVPPPAAGRPTWSLRTSFGLVVAVQVLLVAGSNLPTPLFPIYEHHFGFGSGEVTVLFAAYFAAAIPALMLLGPLADRVGRRRLLVAGIAVTAISSLTFAAARSVSWLFVLLTNGVTQLVLRSRHSQLGTDLGLAGVVIGMSIIATSARTGSLAVAIIGAVIAGAGAGATQMNAMAAVQRIAPLHARAGVVSAYFTLCYVALSVPVIIAGEAADRFGLGAVTAWYVAGLAIVVGAVLRLSHRPVAIAIAVPS